MHEVSDFQQLKHPNVVNLIEVYKRNRKLHLVFEYCDRTVLNELEKHPKGYVLSAYHSTGRMTSFFVIAFLKN